MRIQLPLIPVFVLFATLSPLAAQAAVYTFSELQKTDRPRIPYGEVVTIHGSIADFDKAGEKYSEWMDLSDLSVTSRIGSTSTTTEARISADHREWEFDLEALPAKSLLRLDLKAVLRPSQAGAKKVVEKALQDDRFKTAVETFFRAAKEKDAVVAEVETKFFNELGVVLKDAFPEFLAVSEVPIRAQPAVRDKLGALLNLRQNLKDLEGVLDVTKETSASQAYEAVKKKKTDKESDERARRSFVSAYEDATAALNALVESVRQTVTVTHSVPTSSLSTSDLQKYAGIDYAALYVPNSEELRQFVLANIYWGSVDDLPAALNVKERWFQSRISLSVGWCIGDLSNNQNSDIDGNNAFALGIGFRLNKYFRLSAGSMQYRSKADGSLRGDPFFGISIDVTAFDALKGLVSK